MAIDVLDHHQREGAPFALMLRTYGITQIFTDSDGRPGKLFENHLVDHLTPLGVDVIQVQAQGRGGLGDVLFNPALTGGLLTSRAPSLYVRTEVWLEAVTDLIDRAELIVVLLLMATGGVLEELEAISARGRADRTVVLCFGEWAQPNPLRESVLDQFQRVLHVGDLDPRAPASTFVFGDLVDRLTAIRRVGTAARLEALQRGDLDRLFPVTWEGVGSRYRDLGVAARGVDHDDLAERYFRSAARIEMMRGRPEAAVSCACAQVHMLTNLGDRTEAHSVLRALYREFEAAGWDTALSDSASVRAHSKLVAAQAELLTGAGQIEGALRLLDHEQARLDSARSPRASSALLTARAWALRLMHDVNGVLRAGEEALALARSAQAPLEAGRALIILGIIHHEIGQIPVAAELLTEAIDTLRGIGEPLDIWAASMRLAIMMMEAGAAEKAGVMFSLAEVVAEASSLPDHARLARKEATRASGSAVCGPGDEAAR